MIVLPGNQFLCVKCSGLPPSTAETTMMMLKITQIAGKANAAQALGSFDTGFHADTQHHAMPDGRRVKAGNGWSTAKRGMPACEPPLPLEAPDTLAVELCLGASITAAFPITKTVNARSTNPSQCRVLRHAMPALGNLP